MNDNYKTIDQKISDDASESPDGVVRFRRVLEPSAVVELSEKYAPKKSSIMLYLGDRDDE